MSQRIMPPDEDTAAHGLFKNTNETADDDTDRTDDTDDVEGHGLKEKAVSAAIALSVLAPAAMVATQLAGTPATSEAIQTCRNAAECADGNHAEALVGDADDDGDDVEGHGLKEKAVSAAIALSVLAPAAMVATQAGSPATAEAIQTCRLGNAECSEGNHAEALVGDADDDGDDVEGHGLKEKAVSAAIALSVLAPAAMVATQAGSPATAEAIQTCRLSNAECQEANHAEALVGDADDDGDDVEGHGLKEVAVSAAVTVGLLTPFAGQVISPAAAQARSCPQPQRYAPDRPTCDDETVPYDGYSTNSRGGAGIADGHQADAIPEAQ